MTLDLIDLNVLNATGTVLFTGSVYLVTKLTR